MFMIPLLYLIYIRSGYGAADGLQLPFPSILTPLACVIIGVSLGMTVRHYNKEKQCGWYVPCPSPSSARRHTRPAAIPCPPRLREAPRARLSWA